MTVEQNTPSPETQPGFGDIPINREPQTLGEKPARSRHQAPKAPKKKSPVIILCALIAAVVFLYASTFLFIIPMLVKGPIAANIGHRLNRPVRIEKVSLSPVNFQLHLGGISIGPALDRKEDVPLGTIAAVEGRLLPISLLQGKVVLADVQIIRPAATFIRYQGKNPLQLLRPSAENYAGTVLPSWLSIQGIQLTDGTLSFQDLPTSKHYTLEQIQLNLPSGSSTEKYKEPVLQAVINSSPVTLRGRSHRNSDGTMETRMTLQFKNLDLQKVTSYLPDSLHNLRISSNNTDASFEIILARDTQGMQLAVTGTVNITDLNLQAAKRQFSLKIPTVQMLVDVRPLEKQYRITSLTAIAPQLTLAGTLPAGLSAAQTMLGNFLQSNKVRYAVEQLKIDQGSVESTDHTRWHDLRLQLTNLTNAAAGQPAQPAEVSLQASRDKSTAAFKGEITPDGALTGKLSLHNMEVSQLQSFMPDRGSIRFTQGLLQLEGMLLTKPQDTSQPGQWEITDSSLQVSRFSLLDKNGPLATGQEMSGSECLLQSNSFKINCQQLSFTQTNFSPAGFALFVPADGDSMADHDFLSFDTLNINNSTAEIPLLPDTQDTTNPSLHLTDLQLSLTGMKQVHPESDNLKIKAVAGEQGALDITGSLQPNGQGVLQLSASGIDLKTLPAPLFTSWLVPEVSQGTVQINGRLKIPDLRFAGSLQIDNFIAGSGTFPALGWQQATASDVTVQLVPFSATVSRLVLDQPSITLTTDKEKLPEDLFMLLKQDHDNPKRPLPAINECVINNGSLTSAGAPSGQLNLTNIGGRIAPLHNNTPAKFSLSGHKGVAHWTTTGQTGLTGLGEHTLQLIGFPFPRAAQALFADTFKLDVSQATTDLTISTNQTGTVRLSGITPLPKSDFTLLAALLTDQNNTISLQLPALNNLAPANVLNKAVPDLLNRLRLQAVVSPGRILNASLPELLLPGTIEFLPGQIVPDFMEGLEDYTTLLTQRPHLALAVRGNYDDTADRQALLQVLQEEADARRALENIHREQRRAELTMEQQQSANRQNQPPAAGLQLQEQLATLQPLPQITVQLPPETLPNLARQRAEFVRSYLINTLQIPAQKIHLLPSTDKGARAEIILQPASSSYPGQVR